MSPIVSKHPFLYPTHFPFHFFCIYQCLHFSSRKFVKQLLSYFFFNFIFFSRNFEGVLDKFQSMPQPDSPLLSDSEDFGSMQSIQVPNFDFVAPMFVGERGRGTFSK